MPDEEKKEEVIENKEQETQEVEKKEEATKTFTQDEVNALNAKTKQSERVALLKELGVEDTKSVKEALKKLKEQDDASKSEAEKLKEAVEAEKGKTTTAEQRATIAEAQLEAIKSGVPSDRADKLVKLAMSYDGDEIKGKIEAALKDFPEFKGGAQLDKFGNKIKNDDKPTNQKVEDEFLKAMGYNT